MAVCLYLCIPDCMFHIRYLMQFTGTEMAAAKRQPPETKNKVGRPRIQRPSEENLAEAVAVIEAEAAGSNTDETPRIFANDDIPMP